MSTRKRLERLEGASATISASERYATLSDEEVVRLLEHERQLRLLMVSPEAAAYGEYLRALPTDEFLRLWEQELAAWRAREVTR